MVYQELTSEKYWRASAMSEIAEIKECQSSRSVRAFSQFLVVYLLLTGASFLMAQNPDWLPATLTYLEESGIGERLRSLVAG